MRRPLVGAVEGGERPGDARAVVPLLRYADPDRRLDEPGHVGVSLEALDARVVLEADIGAHAASALGEDVGHEPGPGQERREHQVLGRAHVFEENPGEEPALGVAPDLEASPLPDVRAAAVGPDDEAGLHLALAAVVLNDHPRRPTGLYSGHPRAATPLRARVFRRLQQDLL